MIMKRVVLQSYRARTETHEMQDRPGAMVGILEGFTELVWEGVDDEGHAITITLAKIDGSKEKMADFLDLGKRYTITIEEEDWAETIAEEAGL